MTERADIPGGTESASATAPEVVATVTPEELNTLIANGNVVSPPPQAPTISMLDALLNIGYTLGGTVDEGSYKILAQRVMEYKLTIQQLAICAATGNKSGFEQMVNQLQGAVFQNQVALISLLRNTMEAKLAQVDKPGRPLNETGEAKATEGASQCH